MNRWIARVITFASLAGSVALVPAGVAYAQNSAQDAADPGGHHGRHGHRGHEMGLLGAAMHLDSLTADQKTAIEQLIQTRKTAETPVRQADAQVLTALAQQVEQASINRQALAPTLQARESAATAARSTDQATLQKLHDLLTPAQRAEMIDKIEAHVGHHPGMGGPHAGGPNGPDAGGHEHGPMEMYGKRLGLTDAQKAQIEANLQAAGHAPGQHPAGNPGDHKAEMKAWLDSFKGDTFNATAMNGHPGFGGREGHIEALLEAAVPVLTPAQRAQVASDLRARAAHESHS